MHLAVNAECANIIAASGAIGLLVQELGPGFPADVHCNAARALGSLLHTLRLQSPSLLRVPFLRWCGCWRRGHGRRAMQQVLWPISQLTTRTWWLLRAPSLRSPSCWGLAIVLPRGTMPTRLYAA